MTTLTYGQLPSIVVFIDAFNKNVSGKRFEIHSPANSLDSRMFNELDLFQFGRYNDDNDGMDCTYNSTELYGLCEALAAINNGDEPFDCAEDDVEIIADWAGDFCSSILTTLGFEWV